MTNLNPQRETCLARIAQRQRRATELSIQLTLDAQDSEDIPVLAEAAATLDRAVRELERAHRMLVAV